MKSVKDATSLEDTWAKQEAEDEALRHIGYTGIRRDRVTEDYVIWVLGRQLGWAPTVDAAYRRLAEEAVR